MVSKGKESKAVSVPNVVGQSEGAATTTLSNSGFQVTTEYQASTSVSAGNVISQTPSSGSELDPGKTVHLVISTGSGSTGGGSDNSGSGGSSTSGGSGANSTGGGSGTGSNSTN